MNLKSIFQTAAASVYQMRYTAARSKDLARADPKTVILFTSVSRAELGGNMACVHKRLLERGLDAEYDIRLDLHADIASVNNMSAQFAFIDAVACADIIFCDDYHPFLYLIDYPADVRVVQLWHAVGSFKTIGFARHRKDAKQRKRNSRAHRSYTHVIVSAECDRPHYAEAFNLPLERIYATGVPRIDAVLSEAWQQSTREAFAQRFPQAVGKRVVLFAPTFRGDDVRHASYDFSRIDLPQLAAWCRQNKAVALLKFHPLTQGAPVIPAELADALINASDVREVNDLLPAVDLLVTDYSSVIYEASLLNIPMLFYAYDLREYEERRGFFEPYAKFVPGPVLQSWPALLGELNSGGSPKAVQAFKRKHFAHLDARSTDRVIDLALGIKSA